MNVQTKNLKHHNQFPLLIRLLNLKQQLQLSLEYVQ